jgi:hypothetical protein
MHDIELSSIDRGTPSPRPAHEEIADLLSAAWLRLRTRNSASDNPDKSGRKEPVCLGFSHPQRVNANPNQQEGVRP